MFPLSSSNKSTNKPALSVVTYNFQSEPQIAAEAFLLKYPVFIFCILISTSNHFSGSGRVRVYVLGFGLALVGLLTTLVQPNATIRHLFWAGDNNLLYFSAFKKCTAEQINKQIYFAIK